MHTFYDFYRGKRILITGHTGFKGSWLSIWLKYLGAQIIGISLDPKSKNDLYVLGNLKNKVKDYRLDIRNLNSIKEIFKEEKPDIVFHLAAQPLVLESYKDPVLTFETNIMGTVNILEACRLSDSVKQILVITTDKVYENHEKMHSFSEDDPIGGFDPYSASKAGTELIVQSYRRSFMSSGEKSIATARAGNIIGGGDWSSNRIIPDCVRSIEKDNPIFLRNPKSIRPWQYVLEPLFGYLLLCYKMSIDSLQYSCSWNFGPSTLDMLNVEELVRSLLRTWNKQNVKIHFDSVNIHESTILLLNVQKSREMLGWRTILSIEEAISWTVYWYQNYSKLDGYELSISQIEKYISKWNSMNYQ